MSSINSPEAKNVGDVGMNGKRRRLNYQEVMCDNLGQGNICSNKKEIILN